MKQVQTKYEAPKVELIEMQAQGILCASAAPELNGTGLRFSTHYQEDSAWVI